MEVNDSVGKTEVLLQFNGTGAAKVREALDSGTQKIGTKHPVFGCLRDHSTIQTLGFNEGRTTQARSGD